MGSIPLGGISCSSPCFTNGVTTAVVYTLLFYGIQHAKSFGTSCKKHLVEFYVCCYNSMVLLLTVILFLAGTASTQVFPLVQDGNE